MNYIRNKLFRISVDTIITCGLIIVSFLFACVGSGWSGDFKIIFFKISIHNLKNLEIALWFLLFTKVVISYYEKDIGSKDLVDFRDYKFRSPYLYIMVLISAVSFLFIYRQTLSNYFICDDYIILRDVKKGFFDSVVLMPEFAKNFHFIRPITYLSWFLNYRLFTIKPMGWYLTNIFLHFLSIGIVFLLTKKITGNNLVAIVVGIFFGFAPIHHEVINWIAARGDLICGIFYFLSLYTYILYRENHKKFIYFGISLISFCFALLSKESAISFPLIVILYDLFLYREKKIFQSESLRNYAYYFFIIALYLVMRFLFYGTISAGASLGGAYILMLENLPEYIKGAFLGLFVPMFFPLNWFSVKYLNLKLVPYFSFLNAFILCLLIIFNIKKVTKNKIGLFAIFFTVISSAVLFNIWEIGKSLHASRYYYFISFGFYLFVVTLCLIDNYKLWQKRFNIIGLGFSFCCSVLFLSINNLAWTKATKILMNISSQTVRLYPDFNNVKETRLLYYGLPREYMGVAIYSGIYIGQPLVLTEQISHFYKESPEAIDVRHRGIMVDLNKIDFKKDIILQWGQIKEELYDLTSMMKKLLKDNIKDTRQIDTAKATINNIRLWQKSAQVLPLELSHFRILGKDGFFFSREFDISAKSLPYLSVRMKIIPKSAKYYAGSYSARLYWRTDKNREFSDDNFVEIWLNPKDTYKTYDIYFITPKQILEDERIIQFKFLPAYFPCDLYVDFIKLVVER